MLRTRGRPGLIARTSGSSAAPVDPNLKLDLDLLGTGVPSGWSFTRATSATDVADDGTWLTYASGDIRRTVARGYLAEQPRTNRVFQNSIALIGTGTLTPGQASIDGGSTGVLITEAIGTDAFGILCNTVSSSAEGYEVSVFIKPGTCDRFQLSLPNAMRANAYVNFYLTGAGSVTATGAGISETYVKAFSNGWYRIGFSFGSNATASISYEPYVQTLLTGSETLRPTILGTGRSFTAFGIQVARQGGGVGVTSYIPTTTANVTRNGDVLTPTGGTFAGFYNALGGTIYTEALINSPSQNANVLVISDGSNNNRVYTAQNLFGVVAGGSNQFSPGSVFPAITYGAVRKFAMRFLLNDFNGAQNGTITSDDTSGTIPTVDRMNVGMNAVGNGEQGSCYVSRIKYWDIGKTNAELISMTT